MNTSRTGSIHCRSSTLKHIHSEINMRKAVKRLYQTCSSHKTNNSSPITIAAVYMLALFLGGASLCLSSCKERTIDFKLVSCESLCSGGTRPTSSRTDSAAIRFPGRLWPQPSSHLASR